MCGLCSKKWRWVLIAVLWYREIDLCNPKNYSFMRLFLINCWGRAGKTWPPLGAGMGCKFRPPSGFGCGEGKTRHPSSLPPGCHAYSYCGKWWSATQRTGSYTILFYFKESEMMSFHMEKLKKKKFTHSVPLNSWLGGTNEYSKSRKPSTVEVRRHTTRLQRHRRLPRTKIQSLSGCVFII